MDFEKHTLSSAKYLDVYRNLIFPRLIEEKMLVLLRQGKITKWFSGIGQEGIAVGSAMALNEQEFILPLHRNLGVFTVRNTPLLQLFAQFQGKKEGFTKGRDRSFHFGSIPHHIVGMISHLGAQLSVADGIALGEKLRNEKKCTLVFTGEGGSSQGEFHEALNVASVWKLPVIFLVENNGYALSTPSSEQFSFKSFADKGVGYGMKTFSIDGNNVLEVFQTINDIAKNIRKKPEAVLVEANTFRMRGHEEASGIKYVPKELINEWAKKDPVTNYENFLIEKGVVKSDQIENIKKEFSDKIANAWKDAEKLPVIEESKDEIDDVYKSYALDIVSIKKSKKSEIRFIDAISSGLKMSLEKYDNLILMGQDIAEYGGAFKVTEGFVEKFGQDRIRNTPLCESAIVGIGLGLSIQGFKSVIEMQFADFVTCAFNQIVNNLAKSHYRWSQHSDVVIRMPTGAGSGAGPFHSQSTEAWFFHVPGLKIVYPSSPEDAKGLLIAAIEDPNPVLFFEHKYLYRTLKGLVPDEYYATPIGKGKIESVGEKLTIVSYGLGIHWVLELLPAYDKNSIELIDLRSLLPWDKEMVVQSVKKTNKVLIVHEDTLTGGIGAEIAAFISENCFEYLDAPVKRICAEDTPVPFNKTLESNFLPVGRLKKVIDELLNY